MALAMLGISNTAWSADQLDGSKHYVVKDSGNTIQFLTWTTINAPAPKPVEKYVRKKHFGIWIDFPSDDTCLTTRGLVLERESQAPLQFHEEYPCYVAQGLWHDKYTNAEYTSAKDIEIDHVVPLKNAYLSGASEWNWPKRCAYFNFIGNDTHLVPIQDKANSDKLDRGPDRWMPPNPEYHCQYLSNWMRVKTIWGLRISESEGAAIRKMTSELQCSPQLMKMTRKQLEEQRAIAKRIASECPATPPPPKPEPES